MAKKKVARILVREGGGPPPGFEWNVFQPDFVFDEAVDLLQAPGIAHMKQQVRELARHKDPTHSNVLDLRQVEDFFEIRDSCGALGGLNVRLFFSVDAPRRAVVLLGIIQKQNNGPTPLGDKITMRNRWRRYQRGDFGYPE